MLDVTLKEGDVVRFHAVDLVLSHEARPVEAELRVALKARYDGGRCGDHDAVVGNRNAEARQVGHYTPPLL